MKLCRECLVFVLIIGPGHFFVLTLDFVYSIKNRKKISRKEFFFLKNEVNAH